MKKAVTEQTTQIQNAVAPMKPKQAENKQEQTDLSTVRGQLVQQVQEVRPRYSFDDNGGGYAGL
jgi:hypothetical protein